MKVLLLGSGGREHAMAWKITQSEKLGKLFVAPGNAGTAQIAENVNISVNDFDTLGEFILANKIDLLVVGPEDPLVNGVRDYFESDARFANLMIVGPGKAGAILEGSKDFAKEFMSRHHIPTAAYFTVTPQNIEEGKRFLENVKSPYVLKADGLAAGKGVLILDSLDEAKDELDAMLGGKFGAASSRVVIEEYLTGIEISVFAITDGESYKILGSAKDYKRIGEGDTGLNTGGMGAVSPVPFADVEFNKRVEDEVVRPTIEGFKKDGIKYNGFVFFGLMNNAGKPEVIEYNVRMGDPETEVVMPRLKSDILDLFVATATQRLSEIEIELEDCFCTTVMLVAGGYPEAYRKGDVITGLENVEGSMAFHAGTTLRDGKVVTNGGRVLAVSSFGKTISEALEQSYRNVARIAFDGKNFRRDIGQDLMKYSK